MGQDIWVFSEKPALLYELLTGARTLADQLGGDKPITALVLGSRDAAGEAIARGADSVLWLGDLPEGAIVDDFLTTIAAAVDDRQPSALLVGSTRVGKAIAGRLAARFGVTTLVDVLQFLQEDGQVQARHMIFGGGALRVDRPMDGFMLATVGPGVFQPATADASRSGEISETPFVEPPWRARLVERKPRPAAKVNLRGAKKVVCAGRGVAKQEDLALVNELASCLSAEVACTRPLAEGLDWLPRERYIGISGAIIRPDLYFGLGVSGQVQHLIGMSDARLVVAINKDPNAPIFQQSDYGIAGDLYAIVPELIKAIKERKK